MGNSDNIKSEILRRLDIVEVINEYVPLTHRGSRYVALCPFHVEKTPSFNVVPDKGFFYCFGCGTGGDLFSFVMKIEKVTFPEALRLLADKAGIEYRPYRGDNGRRDAILELHRRVAGSFHYLLTESQEAKKAHSYLIGRGITDEIIERFQIGYAPQDKKWLFNFLSSKGYSESLLDESGLFSIRGSERNPLFRERVIFPIANQKGEIIAFGGRTLSDRPPKYLNSPETYIFQKRANLYGIHQSLSAIKESDTFVLVEGYMDVLAMHQLGHANCIAPLGTALTEMQLQMLKRYASKGILLFDSDEAGARALQKSIIMLEKLGFTMGVVALPEGEDPADIIQKKDHSFFTDLMDRPVDGFEYLLRHTICCYDIESPAGKEGVMRSLVPFLQSVGSDVKREGYMDLIADALGVEIDSVRNDFNRESRRERRTAMGITQRSTQEGTNPEDREALSLDLYLMIAVAINLQYFSVVRRVLTSDDLKDEKAKQLFLSLEECFREGRETLDCLFDRVDDESLKNVIYRKMALEEFSINPDRIVFDSANQIRHRNLLKRRERIAYLLKKSEKSEPWRVKELLEEKMLLDDQIEELKVMRDVRYTE
jgi:DNA primase